MSAKNPRGVIIAGNWKMNHTLESTRSFFSDLEQNWTPSLTDKTQNQSLEVMIFPPATSLNATASMSSLPVQIGSQNTHWENSGAFTGETSTEMLKEINTPLSLVGHSERRQYFGETIETTQKRNHHLLNQGIRTMFCIGETQAERESGQTEAVLKDQLLGGLGEAPLISEALIAKKLIIAYEPVWAIGTGLTATPETAEEAHQFIRKLIWETYGIEASGRTPILYGGSVKESNIEALLDKPNIDGALIGGASLKSDSFTSILNLAGKSLE